jgi:hypothetical protein
MLININYNNPKYNKYIIIFISLFIFILLDINVQL